MTATPNTPAPADTADQANTPAPPAPASAVDTYVAALLAGDYDAATAAYVAATSGDKARIRTAHDAAVQSVMLAATGPDDIARCQAMISYVAVRSAAVGTKTDTPADPRVTVAMTIAGLLAAAAYALPADATDDDMTFIGDLVTLATGADYGDLFGQVCDGPGIAGDVAAYAAKIKLPTGRGTAAPGGDIAGHIYQALSAIADESGDRDAVVPVSVIRARSTDAYPAGAPSAGAISARLFPGTDADGNDRPCTVDGVTPDYTADGTKGARLTA